MRKKITLLSCISFVFLFALIWLISHNSKSQSDIWFSHKSGFYNDPFFLSIESDLNGDIYYTLDGSEPTQNSLKYVQPIEILDKSKEPNQYCLITGVSPELEDSYRKLLANYHGYSVPDNYIDKANIIRAVVIDENGNRSVEANAVYFIGYNMKTGYDNINIITITTDPDNLFDNQSGIYVLGNVFNKTVTDQKIPGTLNWGWWPANYTQRGREWEKKAGVFFFDTNRNLITSGSYGIRIQGGSSRGMLPKSLNLFSRKEYGSTFNQINILYDWNAKSINLYSGAHSMPTKINDYLVNSFCKNLDVTTRTFEPYILFLNGEYWGFYWLMPRFEDEFFQMEYDIKEDETIFIKCGEVEIGEEKDLALYHDMREYISSYDMNNITYFQQVKTIIDIDSFLDYYATEIYIANTDWPNNNFALWRSRYKRNNSFADAKWRWTIYDVNLSMAVENATVDMVQRTVNLDPLFASLMDSEEFKNLFFKKLIEIADLFSPSIINTFIDKYEKEMKNVIEKEFERFHGTTSLEAFFNDCEKIRDFFHIRYQYIIEQYGNVV